MIRNTRIVKSEDHKKILYIKHLGKEPYNEIKFECGKKIIVSYSLSYWHKVFQYFQRVNKGVIVNPNKIISNIDAQTLVLEDNSEFTYSRRRFKNYQLSRSIS
jgi:hypothetical protein